MNYVIREADCDFHKARKEMQQHYLKVLNDLYGQRIGIIETPLFAHEVKGVERIHRVSEILFR